MPWPGEAIAGTRPVFATRPLGHCEMGRSVPPDSELGSSPVKWQGRRWRPMGEYRRGSGDAVPVRGLMSAESRVRLVAVVAVGVGIGLAWLTRVGQVVYQRRHDHSARRPGMGALPGPLVMTREPDGVATAAPTMWGAVSRWTVEAGTGVSRAAQRILAAG